LPHQQGRQRAARQGRARDDDPPHPLHPRLRPGVREGRGLAHRRGGAAGRGQLTDQQLDRAKVAYEQHGSVPAALAAAGLRGSDFITGWKRREEPLDMGFVDEASMLDDRALEDLQEIFPTLLIFGDPAQLPPVQGQGTGAAMIFEKLPPSA
jgi:hypothetical protein